MSVYHQAILNSLPDATRETKTAKAYLFDYNQTAQGQYLWAFLYSPSTLEFSRSAKYSESQTLSAKKQDLQYGYTGGRSLTINEIVLDSWQQGKTIQPLLDGLEKLLECDINKKQYSPPILSFVFGSRRFGPCVLSNISWTETGWLGGQPARATMKITLLEIPEPLSQAKLEQKKQQTQSNQAVSRQSQGMPRTPLTERQAILASDRAKDFLKKNVSRLKPDVQAMAKASSYKLLTDRSSGDIVFINPKGQKIGVVGRFNGTTLKTEGVSTLIDK